MNTIIENRGLPGNRDNNMQGRIGDVQVKQEPQDHETNYDDNIAVLERKILEGHKLLCELRMRRSEAIAMAESSDLNVNREKRALALVEDGVLKLLLEFIGNSNARGFVYGIIPEKGNPVSGSSDNLRSWWKEQVKFYLNGPAAIAKYHYENSITVEAPYDINSTITTPQALTHISDTTLRSILSALMAHCNPPQKDYPLNKGCPPPWWPKGNEEWSHELVFLCCEVPPYRRPHDLKKAWKVVALTAVMKHFFPDIPKIRRIINQRRSLYDKMSAREALVWCRILDREQAFAIKLYPGLFADKSHEDSRRTDQNDGSNVNVGQEAAVIPSSQHGVSNSQIAFKLQNPQEAPSAATLALPPPLPTTQFISNFLKRKHQVAIDL